MTTPTPDAIALGRIRPLATVTTLGVPKTPAQMVADLWAIRAIVDTALATPAPVPPVVPPVTPPPVVPPVVPPVPPAPTPQPPPSPGALPRLSGLQVLGDDFTGYATDGDLRATMGAGRKYNDARNMSGIFLDAAVPYDGHASMRYDQPAGVQTTPQLWPRLPQPLGNVWFRAVIQFSRGWTTRGTLASVANSYKLLALGWGGSLVGRSTVEITNTSGYYVGAGAQGVMPSRNARAGGITTEWTDGAWYDYITHYEITSPTTVRLRHWRQRAGTAPTLRATVNLTAQWGKAPSCSFVCLGLNANQKRVAAQSIWYALWEAVDGAAHADPFGLGAG